MRAIDERNNSQGLIWPCTLGLGEHPPALAPRTRRVKFSNVLL